MLAPQVREVMISANRNAADYARRATRVLGDAFDDFPGPLAGILAGLRAASTPWLAVVPLAIGAIEIWLWRASHSRGTLVLLSMAVVATVWASVALARMVAESHDQGVPINLVRAFEMRLSQGSRPDDDLVYGTWHDQALRLVEQNLDEGRANGHALTFCSVLGQGACPISFLAGDFDAAEQYGETLFEHTERHAIRLWRLWAGCFKGMVMAKRGNVDAGLKLLQSEIDRAGDARFLPRFLLPLGELAACLGEADQIEKGLEAVDETLRRCQARHEQWYVPELLRIKGELMLKDPQQHSVLSAEQCFTEALNLAKQQGALFWELRNALSLARLRVRQDRNTDARQILEPVYLIFKEGFGIADIREAKALLDGLS